MPPVPPNPSPATRSAVVIVNGRARQARRLWSEERVRAALGPAIDPAFVYPAGPAETAAAARRAANEGVGLVIVAGGDGTVNRAAGALAGSNVPLGILPLGTGNDLVRTLGAPATMSEALAEIPRATPRPCDLVEVNGDPSCTVGLLGVVAESAARVIRLGSRESRWRPLVEWLGAASWRISGTVSLLGPDLARRARFTHDDPASGHQQTLERDTIGVFLANGTRLGGGLTLPVPARVDDGVFEICVVGAVPRAKLLYGFTCLMRGWTLPAGVLDVYPARRARIEFDRPGPFSADGELFPSATSFDVRIRPGALLVLGGPGTGPV